MFEDPSDEQVARFVALSDEEHRAALCAQLAQADFEGALRLSAIARAAGRLQRSPRTRLAIANVAAMAERYRDLADVVDPRLRTYGSPREAQTLLRENDAAERFMTAHVLAIGFAERGERASAYELFSYAQGAAAESETGTVVGVAERFAAHARVFGDFDVALRQYATARSFAAKFGLHRWRVLCGIELAELYSDLGRSEEAANALRGALDQPVTLDLGICAAPVRMLLEKSGVVIKDVPKPSVEELTNAALESEDERVAIRAATALLDSQANGSSGRVRAALLRACARVQWLGGASGLLLAAIERGDATVSAAAQGIFGATSPHRVHRYLRAFVLLARAIDARNLGEGDEHVRLASEAARLFAEMHLERLSHVAMDTVVRRISPPKPRISSKKRSSALTKREQEVAALLRTGAPNREIAAMLGISEHTVETHVRSILSRLGLRSRWQLIEWHPEE